MGHADEVIGEVVERDPVKREAEDETEPSVLRPERHAQLEDVELSGEVLYREVVGCNPTDT